LRQGVNTLETSTAAVTEVEGITETVVATITGVTTDIGHQQVFLNANAYWVAAATSETMVLRLRRGTGITGTEVAKVEVSSVASKKNECTIQGVDNIGEVAQASYVLTLAESKAGAKNTGITVALSATA